MNSKDVVLPGESQEEFDALLDSYVKHHEPVGEIERSFVFELAAARWRLRRLVAVETAVFEQEILRVLNDEENPVPEQYVNAAAFDRLAKRRVSVQHSPLREPPAPRVRQRAAGT